MGQNEETIWCGKLKNERAAIKTDPLRTSRAGEVFRGGSNREDNAGESEAAGSKEIYLDQENISFSQKGQTRKRSSDKKGWQLKKKEKNKRGRARKKDHGGSFVSEGEAHQASPNVGSILSEIWEGVVQRKARQRRLVRVRELKGQGDKYKQKKQSKSKKPRWQRWNQGNGRLGGKKVEKIFSWGCKEPKKVDGEVIRKSQGNKKKTRA